MCVRLGVQSSQGWSRCGLHPGACVRSAGMCVPQCCTCAAFRLYARRCTYCMLVLLWYVLMPLQERDWDASSSEDDTDPQQQALAGLLALQPQQQPHWSDALSSSAHLSAVGRPPSYMAAAPQPSVYGPPLAQLSGPAQQQVGFDTAGEQVGPSRLSVGPEGAGAAAAVLALAAAAAGPRARASAAQQHMTPGMMLAQSPIRELLLCAPVLPRCCVATTFVCLERPGCMRLQVPV
jgi:hypothetical protein